MGGKRGENYLFSNRLPNGVQQTVGLGEGEKETGAGKREMGSCRGGGFGFDDMRELIIIRFVFVF